MNPNQINVYSFDFAKALKKSLGDNLFPSKDSNSWYLYEKPHIKELEGFNVTACTDLQLNGVSYNLFNMVSDYIKSKDISPVPPFINKVKEYATVLFDQDLKSDNKREHLNDALFLYKENKGINELVQSCKDGTYKSSNLLSLIQRHFERTVICSTSRFSILYANKNGGKTTWLTRRSLRQLLDSLLNRIAIKIKDSYDNEMENYSIGNILFFDNELDIKGLKNLSKLSNQMGNEHYKVYLCNFIRSITTDTIRYDKILVAQEQLKQKSESVYRARTPKLQLFATNDLTDSNPSSINFLNGYYDVVKSVYYNSNKPHDGLSTFYDFKRYTKNDQTVQELNSYLDKLFDASKNQKSAFFKQLKCAVSNDDTKHTFYWKGTGPNGKKTLMDLVKTMFGQYCKESNQGMRKTITLRDRVSIIMDCSTGEDNENTIVFTSKFSNMKSTDARTYPLDHTIYDNMYEWARALMYLTLLN